MNGSVHLQYDLDLLVLCSITAAFFHFLWKIYRRQDMAVYLSIFREMRCEALLSQYFIFQIESLK